MTGTLLVSVETLMLRTDADGRWAYRRTVTVPGSGESPDAAARRAAGVRADDPDPRRNGPRRRTWPRTRCDIWRS
ncbi:hypothetical protein [Nonomuraea indica]|uniref:Uncharacterized protein n=1 Tax=Nonomuraea indica TaxID=1581193 RepID=A0ABW8A4J7_9ACTN